VKFFVKQLKMLQIENLHKGSKGNFLAKNSGKGGVK
jgi:hypothetical protein